MKNIFFISALLFSFSLFAQENKNYEVIYDFSYQTDSTDINSKKREDMVLFKNDSISLFQSWIKYKSDSIKQNYLKNFQNKPVESITSIDIGKITGGYRPKISMTIQKDFKNRKFIIKKRLGMYEYQYEEPAKADWQIKEDTMTISGYKCQKATTRVSGRNYVVWFAPEVPISDGPFKFFGLPGLVVQAKDTKGFFQFKLKELKEIDKMVLPPEHKELLIVTSKKKYEKAKKNFAKQGIIDQLQASGLRHIVIPEKYKTRRKKNKKSNNPIELE